MTKIFKNVTLSVSLSSETEADFAVFPVFSARNYGYACISTSAVQKFSAPGGGGSHFWAKGQGGGILPLPASPLAIYND